MAKQAEEFDIDGTRYMATHWSPSKVLRLLPRLAKIAGKPIGIFTGAGMEAEIKPDMIGAALESFGTTEPEEFERVVKDVLDGLLIFTDDGKNRLVVFDADFSGRIGHLFKVIGKVISFQFDFLGGPAGVIPALTAKARAAGRIKAL